MNFPQFFLQYIFPEKTWMSSIPQTWQWWKSYSLYLGKIPILFIKSIISTIQQRTQNTADAKMTSRKPKTPTYSTIPFLQRPFYSFQPLSTVHLCYYSSRFPYSCYPNKLSKKTEPAIVPFSLVQSTHTHIYTSPRCRMPFEGTNRRRQRARRRASHATSGGKLAWI